MFGNSEGPSGGSSREPTLEGGDAEASLLECVEQVGGAIELLDVGAAVFEYDDRAALGEGAQSAPKDRGLGAFNVHLDEIDGLVGVKHVIEAARGDRDGLDLSLPVGPPGVADQTSNLPRIAQGADEGVVLDDEETHLPGLVGQRQLVDLDFRKLQAQFGRLVRNGLEGVMVPLGCQNLYEPEDLTGRRPDVDAVGVRPQDPSHGFHGKNVVPAAGFLRGGGPPMAKPPDQFRGSEPHPPLRPCEFVVNHLLARQAMGARPRLELREVRCGRIRGGKSNVPEQTHRVGRYYSRYRRKPGDPGSR